MKMAILGFAREGRTAYEYWDDGKNELTICDQNDSLDIPDRAKSRLGPDYLSGLDKFDILVRTPNLHPRAIVAANPGEPDILRKVTTVTNEFFRVCPTKKIIGVTGTKGKGTTSSLIAKMLEVAGKRVHLGGNIGIPALELLKQDIRPEDYVVLELSNFQMIDVRYSPSIAVCLMVVPEHLNWHENIDEYITAKQQLFRWQTAGDKAIYYAENDNSEKVAAISAGQKVPYFKPPGAEVVGENIVIEGESICSVNDLKLLGRHNWQNACAALTAFWQVTKDSEAARAVLTSFSGLPFRIEFRKKVKGVRYYNDSFASTPDAAIAAIESIPGQKVLIAGGFDRGLNLSPLVKDLLINRDSVRKVVLIGATAEHLAKVFSTLGFDDYVLCPANDMDSIVRFAAQQARNGDAVVLSPGFASFDMFKDFEDRGRQFNDAVDSL